MNLTVNLLSVNTVTGVLPFLLLRHQKLLLGDDSLKICPRCNKENSVFLIPLQRDEAYRYTFEDKRGLDIQFLKIKTPHNNL